MVNYMRDNKYQFRPDEYRLWSASDYYRSRLLAYTVPFLNSFWTPLHLPKYTPFEKSIYNAVATTGDHMFSFANICSLVQWVLVVSGACATTQISEVLAQYLLISAVGKLAVVAREVGYLTKDRLPARHALYSRAFALR
jgi:hypothetical protein